MSLEFVLPAVLAIAVAGSMSRLQWRLRPRLAVPLLSLTIGAAAAVVTLVLALTATGFVLGPARSSVLLEWCRAIPLHHHVDPPVGLAAVALCGFIALRAGRVLLARRRVARLVRRSGRLAVVESTERFAYAVPTREGCVVVSTGLLQPLSPQQRQAVFAHERAHLRLRHHHYLLVAELGCVVLPFLGPLRRQLQFATERAADEAAAVVVADRRTVAAAIVSATPGGAAGALPALGGSSAARRVEALLWPEREPMPSAWRTSIATAVGCVAVGALAVQVHHYSTLIAHLCHGVG